MGGRREANNRKEQEKRRAWFFVAVVNFVLTWVCFEPKNSPPESVQRNDVCVYDGRTFIQISLLSRWDIFLFIIIFVFFILFFFSLRRWTSLVALLLLSLPERRRRAEDKAKAKALRYDDESIIFAWFQLFYISFTVYANWMFEARGSIHAWSSFS